MRSNRFIILGLTAVVLGACAEPGLSRRGQFRSDYLVARQALEVGQYDRAIRHYQALAPKAGPFGPRIRLEYAHSLLRNDQFGAAAEEARTLAAEQTGTARAAALAVQGTAEHELALSLMDLAAADPAVTAYLRSARVALGEAIADPGGLDPLGALAIRKKSIDALLAS